MHVCTFSDGLFSCRISAGSITVLGVWTWQTYAHARVCWHVPERLVPAAVQMDHHDQHERRRPTAHVVQQVFSAAALPSPDASQQSEIARCAHMPSHLHGAGNAVGRVIHTLAPLPSPLDAVLGAQRLCRREDALALGVAEEAADSIRSACAWVLPQNQACSVRAQWVGQELAM